MKKVAIVSMATLALAGTASAEFNQAPPGGSAELTIEITGEVEEICGITASSNSLSIDFGELSGTDAQITRGITFGLLCNAAGGARVEVSSANDGYLLRDGTETGPGNQIPYTFDLDKGSDEFSYGLGTRPVSLETDRTFDIAGSEALREGRDVGAYIVVRGVKGPDFQGAPTTTVYAGAYYDIVTVSLSAQ